jgi:hypothetical protein
MLCKVCRFIRRYPRHHIDQLLDDGASYRSIAMKFPDAGTEMTIANHHKHHWNPHGKKQATPKMQDV